MLGSATRLAITRQNQSRMGKPKTKIGKEERSRRPRTTSLRDEAA